MPKRRRPPSPQIEIAIASIAAVLLAASASLAVDTEPTKQTKRWAHQLDAAIDSNENALPQGTVLVVEEAEDGFTETATVHLKRGEDVIASAAIETSSWEICAGIGCVTCSYLGCPFVMFPLLSYTYYVLAPKDVRETDRLLLTDGGGQSRVTTSGEACTASLWMMFGVCLIPIAPACGPAGLKVLGPTLVSPFIMSTSALQHWRRDAAARGAVDDLLQDVQQREKPTPLKTTALAY